MDTRGGRSPIGRQSSARMIAFGRWASLLLSSALAKPLGWVRALMAWSISAGPMPTHIAFIMDGNRRFADRLHVDRHIGHSHGYDALLGTLKDCFDLNVKVVTLFAFSIDNFYRPPVEVSALMELMQSKLEVLVEKHGLAIEYGICVRVLGDLHLLPEGVQRAAEKAMFITRQNRSHVLNLCVSYTATHEIAHSIQKTCNNFLAAWDESCGDFCHLPHCRVHRRSNEVCNADVVNSDHVCESIFCIEQCKNNDHDELAGHNDGDNYGAESIIADRGGRSSATDKSDGINCAGLRRRNHLNSRDSNKLGLHKTCDSDSCLDIDTNGDVTVNGLPPTENTFHEVDDKSFEVVDCSYGMPTDHCFSPCTASTKGLYSQRLLCSCEDQKSLHSSYPENLRKPCCLDDRILKVAEDCVSEEEIEKNLYTYPCPPPDLLIRTSGETRLSNFLLWQSSFSHLAFCNALWPEFSFRHLFFIILEYQRALPSLLKKRQCYNSESWR